MMKLVGPLSLPFLFGCLVIYTAAFCFVLFREPKRPPAPPEQKPIERKGRRPIQRR